jgi:hypothetical protein
MKIAAAKLTLRIRPSLALEIFKASTKTQTAESRQTTPKKNMEHQNYFNHKEIYRDLLTPFCRRIQNGDLVFAVHTKTNGDGNWLQIK